MTKLTALLFVSALAADATLQSAVQTFIAQKDSELSALRAERDRALATVDSLPAPSAVQAQIKERVELIARAAKIAPSLAADALVEGDAQTVLRKVLTARGISVAADASLDYLRARVDGLEPTTAQTNAAAALSRQADAQPQTRVQAPLASANFREAQLAQERAKLARYMGGNT